MIEKPKAGINLTLTVWRFNVFNNGGESLVYLWLFLCTQLTRQVQNISLWAQKGCLPGCSSSLYLIEPSWDVKLMSSKKLFFYLFPSCLQIIYLLSTLFIRPWSKTCSFPNKTRVFLFYFIYLFFYVNSSFFFFLFWYN